MGYNTIIYEKEGNIGIITLNRPKSMNSINLELINDLNQVLTEIEADKGIGAVILTGHEKFFGAGADIKEINTIDSAIKAHDFVNVIRPLFDRLENLEKPTIAAVSGLALGGGCELTLACDFRIAAENAQFGLPEVKIGVLPGGGGTQRLPRLIGAGRAKEMLYIGDPIDAEEAYRVGLANKVVKLEALMDEAKKMAAKLARQPVYGIKMIKACVNKGTGMDLRSGLDYESRCFEFLFSTEDQTEGIKAFVEKRKPVYQGK
ncbi:MAG: enoyl-CoA hydratase-related protein [Desulfatiglans sp.]|jgi:enoyl-CoA hydratase|nr:enoyl-CoA hydratase-related protein [Thermodesulfobacteriota bacterium]MEE4353083.1 enoyl-CoA hydratase-related protein [Desulfatiglans sp.]